MSDRRAGRGWMTVDEASHRLGVKPATLYAYVSRGALTRRRSPDGHSMFDPADVERLARRGRPRRAGGGTELTIESAITTLGEDRPYFRGRDALELAARYRLEDVAEWLWTGEETALVSGGRESAPAWRVDERAAAVGRAAQAALPPDVLPLERLQVIAPALAAADPLRLRFDPAAVTDTGRGLIAGMVECLPGPVTAGTLAGRLWPKLTQAPAHPGLVDALRAALVLMADHELAASTLAARVAASVRADPYAVVTAALGVVGGGLHGGASLGAEAMLTETVEPGRAPHVMGQRLRQGDRIPAFGHSVYRTGDARAGALLERIRAAVPDHPRLAVGDAMLAEARRRHLPEVNVDFALALLADVAGMVRGAGEAIFAVARTAGWLAHAMEEYAHPTRVRLRASYTGSLP